MLPLEEVCFTDSNIMMKSDMKRLSGGSVGAAGAGGGLTPRSVLPVCWALKRAAPRASLSAPSLLHRVLKPRHSPLWQQYTLGTATQTCWQLPDGEAAPASVSAKLRKAPLGFNSGHYARPCLLFVVCPGHVMAQAG